MELSVERIGKHTGVRYGASHRVLPTATLRTARGARVIAEILWDSEHPKPNLEEAAEDWNAARRRAIGVLALDIALRSTAILTTREERHHRSGDLPHGDEPLGPQVHDGPIAHHLDCRSV